MCMPIPDLILGACTFRAVPVVIPLARIWCATPVFAVDRCINRPLLSIVTLSTNSCVLAVFLSVVAKTNFPPAFPRPGISWSSVPYIWAAAYHLFEAYDLKVM